MWWFPSEGFDCCEDAAERMRAASRMSERFADLDISIALPCACVPQAMLRQRRELAFIAATILRSRLRCRRRGFSVTTLQTS